MRGKNHDRSSALLTPIIAIALTQYLPAPLIYAEATGFVLGFSHFSPDIDLPQSLPSRRWGFLHPMWRWYRSNHKHRGRSHFPLWGTFERPMLIGNGKTVVVGHGGFSCFDCALLDYKS